MCSSWSPPVRLPWVRESSCNMPQPGFAFQLGAELAQRVGSQVSASPTNDFEKSLELFMRPDESCAVQATR